MALECGRRTGPGRLRRYPLVRRGQFSANFAEIYETADRSPHGNPVLRELCPGCRNRLVREDPRPHTQSIAQVGQDWVTSSPARNGKSFN